MSEMESEMGKSWENASEADIPKIFTRIFDDGSGMPRALAFKEDLAKADPVPHDVQMGKILARLDKEEEDRQRFLDLQESERQEQARMLQDWKDEKRREAARTITVTDAWLQLRKALKVLLQVLPCGFLGWHAKSVLQDRTGRSVMVCRRCRAWREI